MKYNQPIDTELLYEKRMLIFIEEEPQSNEYRQVMFDKNQFKKISDAILSPIYEDKARDGFEICAVNLSDDTYRLPDLNTINNE